MNNSWQEHSNGLSYCEKSRLFPLAKQLVGLSHKSVKLVGCMPVTGVKLVRHMPVTGVKLVRHMPVTGVN